MQYSRSKYLALIMIFIYLAGYLLYTATRQALPHSALPAAAHISHGLRAYIDPDSGEFVQPEVLSIHTASIFSRHAGSLSVSQTERPIERASDKAGGGYTINMQEQYRPKRGKVPQAGAGS